jgi:hypothetical protein
VAKPRHNVFCNAREKLKNFAKLGEKKWKKLEKKLEKT